MILSPVRTCYNNLDVITEEDNKTTITTSNRREEDNSIVTTWKSSYDNTIMTTISLGIQREDNDYTIQ